MAMANIMGFSAAEVGVLWFLRGLGGSRMDLQGDKRPPVLAFQPEEGLLARVLQLLELGH